MWEKGIRATWHRVAEAYTQHKLKHITTRVSVRNDFNSFFTSPLSNLVCIWNANTCFRSQIKSRSELLISELSHWRSYIYTEWRERMFKIWIRFSWWYSSYRPFSTVFFSVKGNLSIFITLFVVVVSDFLAHFCCCDEGQEKELKDTNKAVSCNWNLDYFWIMIKLIMWNF